ncbi:MAG: PfkB family carbohydrate kinase [bacterium]
MSIVVVGSVALDSIETPSGKMENALGGSATYFSIAASFFNTDIRLVAVIGSDFPQEYIDLLKNKGIDLEGLERADGKTFRWKGSYGFSLGGAKTLSTELNVFEKFVPKIPDRYKNSEYVFLANINPELQLDVLKQIKNSKLVVCDTMNLWIAERKEKLLNTIKHVDIFIINDEEAKQLTGEAKVDMAGRKILELGPRRVIIKKGEHGAVTITRNSYFSIPAYPLKLVVDPTGAGDSFAGGFMGYLASTGEISEQNIRKAMVYGTVMASFNVEDFSINRQRTLTKEEIESRFAEMHNITQF